MQMMQVGSKRMLDTAVALAQLAGSSTGQGTPSRWCCLLGNRCLQRILWAQPRFRRNRSLQDTLDSRLVQ